jgi:hypothetical protein
MRHGIRIRRAPELVVALCFALFAASSVAGQGVTTSAITGTVTGQSGEPLTGVQVIATHMGTGRAAGTLTRDDGRYLIQGLQPGGPYTIRAEGLGFAADERADVQLTLGQTARFDFTLRAQAVELAALDIAVERAGVISKGRTGASTTVSDSAVSRLPTLSRNFVDFTRLTPQISTRSDGSAGAGRNNRFNSIQIDGAVNNDLFGLGSTAGQPGGSTQARPISLEAIQQFQVVLAPFDVRQGGFTGAGINAITKSGTNDVNGSLTYFRRDDAFVGRYRFDQAGQTITSAKAGDFDQTDIGGSLGGPVVRDQLHFFVAGEYTKRREPNLGVAVGRNSSITAAEANAVADVFRTRYGFDPGSPSEIIVERGSVNLFGRLDFTLSPQHRLTLRHNYVDADADELFRADNVYQLSGTMFDYDNRTNSSVAQLNSALGGGYFNELRLGYSTIRDKRVNSREPFPFVTVNLIAGPGGNRAVVGGTENFSTANALDQDILEITDDFSFARGRHTITLGTHNEFFDFSNLFARNLYGNYTFANVTDFQSGVPNRYEATYLLPGGRPRSEFNVQQFSLYAQDQWDVMDNVVLTLGLRYDITRLPDQPANNPAVETAFNRRTDDIPQSGGQFNPRLGFNWDVMGDRSTQVRGGAGLFSGRTPFVWVSNAYGNTGLDYVRFTCSSAASAPAFEPDPFNQPRACRGTTSLAPNEINLIDPDFEFPQVLRFSGAVDRRLPMGFVGTLEAIYTKTVSDATYRELTVGPETGTVEGRPRYSRNLQGFSNVTDITNTDEGYTYNITAQVQRSFRDNWDLSLAYSFTRARDVTNTLSSQAASNWRRNAVEGDPNDPPLRTGAFEIPHRILAFGSYRAQLLRNAPTDISVIYVGESGRVFSYNYNGDVNNDGSTENDLVYVPLDASEIRFAPTSANQPITPQQSWENLNAFIEDVACLREARGRIVQRNACREPWNNRIDLRIAQTVPSVRGHAVEITLDIFNFANMLNRKWGREERISGSNQLDPLLRVRSTTPVNGRVEMDPFGAGRSVFVTQDLNSRYQIQLGARYAF